LADPSPLIGSNALLIDYRYNLNDHLSLTANTQVFYNDGEYENRPENLVISVGNDKFQIDLGWRQHWYGPGYMSSFIYSDNPPSLPGITLHNPIPFDFLGFQYEFFLGQQTKDVPVRYGDRVSMGKPYIAGVALAFTPVKGFTIGAYRLMQFGGGERPVGAEEFFGAFVKPRAYDNDGTSNIGELGNQLAGLSSNFTIEINGNHYSFLTGFYGEDTEGRSGRRLGNVSTTFGAQMFFPSVYSLLIQFEHAEWDSAWYGHHIYPTGLLVDGASIGHWFPNNMRASLAGNSHTVDASVFIANTLIGIDYKQAKLIDNQLPYTSTGVRIAKEWRQVSLFIHANYWSRSNYDEKITYTGELKWQF